MKNIVNTSKDVKVDVVNVTTNFKVFKTLKYNRGEDSSIDNTRLAKFKKLYESGDYFLDVIHVFINLSGIVIDGHHKLELHKEYKIPVNFIVLTQPEFNVKGKVKLLGAIARYNAITSKWDSKAHFNTALKLGLPLAIEIENIQAKYNEEFELDGRYLTSNRVYSLLSHDKKRLDSNLVTVEDYDNEKLLEVSKMAEFEKEMRFACTILKELQNWNSVYEETAKITPFHMVRAIMPNVWDNMLNMEMFVDEVKGKEFNKRFKDTANTVKGCNAYMKRLQKKMLNL